MIELFRFFNRLYLPFTILFVIWLLYRSFVKRDNPALLFLIIGVVIVVDTYMSTGIYLPGLERGSIRYSELLIVLYFFSHFSKAKNNQHVLQKTDYIKRINKLLFIYVLLFLASILRSDDVSRHLLYSFRQTALAPFIVYIMASWGFQSKDDYKRFCYYLLIFSVFVAMGSFQMMFFDSMVIKSPIEDLFYHAVRNNRFASYFGNPNRLGSFYILIIPSLFCMLFYMKSMFRKLVVFMFTLCILFIFFKTFSRGAYLGFGVAVLSFIFFTIKGFPLWRKLAFLLVILIVIPIFSPNIYSGIYDRLTEMQVDVETAEYEMEGGILDDEIAKERKSSRSFIWSKTIKIIPQHPFFGVGWGIRNYARSLMALVRQGVIIDEEAWALIHAEHPHNSYLFMAVFLGNVALIVFLAVMWWFYRSGIKFFRECRDDELRLINFGFICGITGYLIAVFFDYQLFEKNSSVPFWVIVGLSLSLLMHVQEPQKRIQK